MWNKKFQGTKTNIGTYRNFFTQPVPFIRYDGLNSTNGHCNRLSSISIYLSSVTKCWSETAKNNFISELTYQLKINYNNCISCNCCNWQNCWVRSTGGPTWDCLEAVHERGRRPFCFSSPSFQECNPWKKKIDRSFMRNRLRKRIIIFFNI